MARVTIELDLDSEEDREAFKLWNNRDSMNRALVDIYNKARGYLKYGEYDVEVYSKALEEIADLSGCSGIWE